MGKDSITYDNFPQEELAKICEAENNAEVMQKFINETIEYKNNFEKRREEILFKWATYMNSFWDEGNDLGEEDHYHQQWDWGSDLLDCMDEYIESENKKIR